MLAEFEYYRRGGSKGQGTGGIETKKAYRPYAEEQPVKDLKFTASSSSNSSDWRVGSMEQAHKIPFTRWPF